MKKCAQCKKMVKDVDAEVVYWTGSEGNTYCCKNCLEDKHSDFINAFIRDLCFVEFRVKSATGKLVHKFLDEYTAMILTKVMTDEIVRDDTIVMSPRFDVSGWWNYGVKMGYTDYWLKRVADAGPKDSKYKDLFAEELNGLHRIWRDHILNFGKLSEKDKL